MSMTDDELEAMMNEIEEGAPKPVPSPLAKVVTPEPATPAPAPEPAKPVTVEPVAIAAPEPAVEPSVAAPVAPPAAEKVAVIGDSMLKRFIDADQLKSDVSINPEDLDTAMMQHASLYVHYAVQTVQARRQYERLKHACEILEATLDGHYRESLSEGAAKKPTEAAIRNAVVADRRWSSGQAKMIEAQSIWKLCEVAESALVQRKDLILEVARDRRKEREGQLRVLENQDMRDRVTGMLKSAGS